MKSELIAIPVFEERISPLLDVSERFVIFEVKDSEVIQKIEVSIKAETERFRIQKLKELGVAVVISGAVSRYLSHIIIEAGITHIPWINGRVNDVINSYLNNTLESILPEKGSCGGMMRKGKLITGAVCGKESALNEEKEII